MTPEQKAVVLDAALEMLHNDEWWGQFEYEANGKYFVCTKRINPLVCSDSTIVFHRRPKTITVTIPMPNGRAFIDGTKTGMELWFRSQEDRDTALAAIRAEMEKK